MKFTHTVNVYFHNLNDSEQIGYFTDLINLGEQIMTKLSDYIAQQDEYNTKLESSLANLGKDIQKLNDIIAKLQATAGEITAEDQALLDKASARSQSLVDKYNALDELTPPDTTEVPPTEE